MNVDVHKICENFEENVYLYLDGELSEAETQAVNGHLLECTHCRELESEARGMQAAIHSMEDFEPPQDAWSRFAARLASEENLDLDVDLPPRSSFSLKLVGVSALAVAAGLLLMVRPSPSDPPRLVQTKLQVNNPKTPVAKAPEASKAVAEIRPESGVKAYQPAHSARLEVTEMARFAESEVSLQATHSDALEKEEKGVPRLSEITIQAANLDQMVALSPKLHMDYLPVTNREYKRFVEATGHNPPFHWGGRDYKQVDPSGFKPVTYISWEDARSFCEWEGKRLPTASEWEFAATGGDDRSYPWGNEYASNRANTRDSGLGLIQVGSFAGNISALGVRDMLGNVREWTADEPAADTVLPTQRGRLKIMKGASFTDPASTASVQSRYSGDKEAVLGNAGVRCVASNLVANSPE